MYCDEPGLVSIYKTVCIATYIANYRNQYGKNSKQDMTSYTDIGAVRVAFCGGKWHATLDRQMDMEALFSGSSCSSLRDASSSHQACDIVRHVLASSTKAVKLPTTPGNSTKTQSNIDKTKGKTIDKTKGKTTDKTTDNHVELLKEVSKKFPELYNYLLPGEGRKISIDEVVEELKKLKRSEKASKSEPGKGRLRKDTLQALVREHIAKRVEIPCDEIIALDEGLSKSDYWAWFVEAVAIAAKDEQDVQPEMMEDIQGFLGRFLFDFRRGVDCELTKNLLSVTTDATLARILSHRVTDFPDELQAEIGICVHPARAQILACLNRPETPSVQELEECIEELDRTFLDLSIRADFGVAMTIRMDNLEAMEHMIRKNDIEPKLDDTTVRYFQDLAHNLKSVCKEIHKLLPLLKR